MADVIRQEALKQYILDNIDQLIGSADIDTDTERLRDLQGNIYIHQHISVSFTYIPLPITQEKEKS